MSIDLNAPEVQEAIEAAVKKATEPLLAKRDELLSEVKTLRKGKQVAPEDVEKLETAIDDLKTQLSEAQKAAKNATKETDGLRKQLQDADGFTTRLLVDNGLNDQLAKAGVTNPVHLKAVKAMLSGQVQVAIEGDQRIAKVGDKALADFIGEWAKSDEAKFFVQAPGNSGGGAAGGSPAGTTTGKIDGDDKERASYFASRFKLSA